MKMAQPTLWIGPLLVALVTSALTAQSRPRTLPVTVNGQTGQAQVVRINGKSYIEVEALARISNGSVGFQPNGLVLTLPGASQDVPSPNAAGYAATPAADPADAEASALASTATSFSKDFLRAGIDEISSIRDWHVALRNAVQTNYPVSDDWISTYRRTIDSKVALASAAVTSSADRQALPLLEAQFANMQKLSSRFVGLHDSVTYTPTSALDDDPLDKQIVACAQGLTALLSSRQFQDVPACH